MGMRILPFRSNLWDRIFIGVVIMFAVHLLWVRFVEKFLPLTVATVGTLFFLVLLVITG